MAKTKEKNTLLISTAKKTAVGEIVENLDVVVSTAGTTKQVDESLSKQQSEQEWEQKLGLTDSSGHIWSMISMKSYNPIVKGSNLIIRKAGIDEITNKAGNQEKILRILEFEIPAITADEMMAKEQEENKFEGILDPMIEDVLRKYDISVIDALWPCKRGNKTNWIIYHRYCEQIAAKAGITFEDPEVVLNEVDSKGKRTVVLLVRGRMGYVKEWSYGEASPQNTIVPYPYAMAEKRAKDRVILKLAGFHGMVYSETEENWENENAQL